MANKTSKNISVIALGMGLALVATDQAAATEGYFQHGWGARHGALGGAGVADGRDASAAALNPASLVKAGNSLQLAATLFSPRRSVTGTGEPGLAPLGTVDSVTNFFLVPNIAYSKQIDENSAWGITIYGNGGMNSDYPAVPRALLECGGGAGVFCGGEAGVNLSQAFIAPGYARDFGKISVGITPLIVMQMFEAKGLVAFSGFSSDPANLTGPGIDTSFGFGAKIGFEAELTDSMRFGASYQTKVNMSSFETYTGLFADQGDFDVPQNYQVGFAGDFGKDNNITLMVDYKKIFYSDIGSVGGTANVALPFGVAGGPGFGWQDVDIYKIGMEYRRSEDWTWRLGFAHNSAAILPSEVTLNILAPATVQDHITGGFSYSVSDSSYIEVAGMYAPDVGISGAEPAAFGNPNHTNTIAMKQYSFTVSWTMKFGD
ncbi:MAG: outer membrane protein transport protein [Sphingomonadales bacterium]|nr:outer membrane protein transport protein [Sphingomonadales bacterium]